MKKLLIILVMLIPIIGKAQTKQTPHMFYDSVGNVYYYDPSLVIVEKDTTTKPLCTKRKTVARITSSGRKIKYSY
jgi:hypothetical protein